MTENIICETPEATFALGERIGERLKAGDAVLLHGGLGAGKTLLTKGVMNALEFAVDEVTSPSFTLVNHYRTPALDVFHIDLWRIEAGAHAAFDVGLDEILEQNNSVVVIEWAEKLANHRFPSRVFNVKIEGDGDEPRSVTIQSDCGPAFNSLMDHDRS
jgi:tRNA threonylcarbamoyladenosine biosynthesis protein TsaE